MTAEQFLKQPNFDEKVCLVYGEERFLTDAVKDAMIALLGVDMMNLDVREEKTSADEVISITQQMPCFAEHRLLILNDPELMKNADGDALVKYFPEMPDTAKVLILLHAAPDKRRSLYKYLSKNALVIEAEKPQAGALTDWICKKGSALGIHLEKSAAQFLTEYAGEDMLTLQGELEKLAMLGKKQITAREIEAIASATPDYNVFQLHTCMMQGDYRRAFALAHKEFQAQKTYIPLIALLVNKFHLMYMTKNCLLSGMNRRQAAEIVAKTAKVSPYAAKYAAEECERFSMEQIKRALKIFSDYEYALKFGGADEGIESVLCRVYLEEDSHGF